MFNPLDMLQARNAAGMQGVAQQFGLTPEQTRLALEALMPAFALGLQPGAGGPAGLSPMFGMAGGRPAAGPAEALLGPMFGSPALTQAILHQASSASGVGAQVLRQMLPVMAGAVVASIVHMLLNPQAPEPKAAPAPAPAPAPFGGVPAWAEMMRAFLPPATVPEPPAPAAKPEPEPPGGEMFRQMLKSGAEAQEQNVRAMQGLFEAFWTEADPPRSAARAADAPKAGGPAGAAAPARPEPRPPEGPQRPRRGRPASR